jgi:hypothetical protein
VVRVDLPHLIPALQPHCEVIFRVIEFIFVVIGYTVSGLDLEVDF